MDHDFALSALSDATRRRTFDALRRGPRPVGALARELGISQPLVSRHLKVLRTAGLVRSRAAGTRRLYEPDPVGLTAVRAYFDGFWSDVLEAYAQSFEEDVDGG